MFIGSVALATAITMSPVELTQDDQNALKLLGSTVTLAPIDIGPIGTAQDWFPEKAWDVQFRRTGGDKVGTTDTWTMRRVQRAPGTPIGSKGGGWVLTLKGKTASYLDVRASGILMPTAQDLQQSVFSRFNPPQPLVLSGQTPGTPVTSKSSVKVYDVHDPTVVAHTGELDFTWTDLGGYRITTPAGTFDTHLVRVNLSGTVGPASIKETRWTFLAKGVGPVALIDGKNISAILVYNDDEHYAAVRTTPVQGASDTPAK